MASRLEVGVVALVCAAACGLFSALATVQMVDEVNKSLPQEEQFAQYGWFGPNFFRLYREYKRLCPSGSLARTVRWQVAFGFACLLIGAWAFGVFG
jgi:hypothetical protein